MNEPILFFDGVCNLCNRSIDFLIRKDRSGSLRFAPLQGKFAGVEVPELADQSVLSSIVFKDSTGMYLRSDAVLKALQVCGGGWSIVAKVALWVPRPIRDFVYRVIAANRYKLWGRKETCRIPTDEERAKFLD